MARGCPHDHAKFQAMGAPSRVASGSRSREPWRPWSSISKPGPSPFRGGDGDHGGDGEERRRPGRGRGRSRVRRDGGGGGGGAARRAAAGGPPRPRALPPPLLPRPRHGGGSEPAVAPGGGAVAGGAAADELRGAAHRRRLHRALRPRRRQPPRPRHITDQGLIRISTAECVKNLTSISLWGLAGITDNGVIQLVSRAHSLQHLNIGGTFITDESLYAVAKNCINLKSIIVWSCRHVTEAGLVALVGGCRKLESINVGGMRVPPESFAGLLAISPALQIRSITQVLNASVQVS